MILNLVSLGIAGCCSTNVSSCLSSNPVNCCCKIAISLPFWDKFSVRWEKFPCANSSSNWLAMSIAIYSFIPALFLTLNAIDVKMVFFFLEKYRREI